MKRRMIALVLTTALMGSMVSGCGAADTAQEKTVDEETETGQTNGVFTGELEKNVTIQVLENDTAISKGYFKELIEAFNEAYKDEGIQAVDANMDPSDIGFAAGESEKGAWVLSQLAGVMNEDCIDDTITTNAYSKLADGTYFATISTPDVYSTFLDELVKQYETEGLSHEEAETKAKENLVLTSLPKLPESGDLTEEDPAWIDTKTMGGVNGYAISAYTKAPNACLAFVDFATSYEMMIKRSEMLGIAPAREDVAKAAGGTAEELFSRLEDGNIILMPSVKEVSQIWTPGQTFFIDLAKDVFRPENEKKYKDTAAMKAGLEDMSEQIYNAIFTLE